MEVPAAPDPSPRARARWLARWRDDGEASMVWAVRIGLSLVVAGWIAVIASAFL